MEIQISVWKEMQTWKFGDGNADGLDGSSGFARWFDISRTPGDRDELFVCRARQGNYSTGAMCS